VAKDVLSTARALAEAVIVAVVRDKDQGRAAAIVDALLSAGIRALEVTAPTPGCYEILRAHAGSNAVLGVGTVMDTIDLSRAKDAGARFVVSPIVDEEIIRKAREMGMVAIPGAMTPTEIVTAHRAGADFIKIFPISAVGGPKYVRLIRGPLPNVPFWVSGSVSIEEIPEYLDAGAKLLGLTTALTGDPEKIGERVARALDALKAQSSLVIVGPAGRVELDVRELSKLPESEHVDLGSMFAGRLGNAVRLRSLLERAGVPRESEVDVESGDGAFKRSTSAALLYDGGVVHHATDGVPLSRDAGGPLRLYVAGGASGCDNVKALARITVRGLSSTS
jgi:2-dehydro-3-deoxyphosphogluconate aldolase / (4S)-4-hydroxy-2-oxoglutarate aldolase